MPPWEQKLAQHVAEVKRHNARRRKPVRDEDFIARLRSLVDECEPRTIGALAELVDIPERTIGAYLAGTDPTRRALIKIAERTGVSLAWLAAGAGPKRAADVDPDPARLAAALEETERILAATKKQPRSLAIKAAIVVQVYRLLPSGDMESVRELVKAVAG